MQYNFKVPFQVADSGKMIDATSISITSPTNQVCEFVSNIDTEFSNAILAISEKTKDKEQKNETQVSGKDFVMIMNATKCDMKKCFYSLREILKKNGKINGTILVTDSIFDKISYDDTKGMLGEYIKDFLFFSHQG